MSIACDEVAQMQCQESEIDAAAQAEAVSMQQGTEAVPTRKQYFWPTLEAKLRDRSSNQSSSSSARTDNSSRGSAPADLRSAANTERIRLLYERAMIPKRIDTVSNYSHLKNFCLDADLTSDGKFTCYDCDQMFYSEQDCYEHAYPNDSLIGDHTWITVDPMTVRSGLHVLRWAAKGNDSYIFSGEHAVTVGNGDVVYLSKTGVVKTAMKEFVKSDPLYLQMYNCKTRLVHDKAAIRAMAAVGKVGYHPIFMNSEHFASWACMNYKRSPELWGVGAATETASVGTQAAAFLLAGPAAFFITHGALNVAKWATASLLVKDSALRQWDDMKAVFGDVHCCVCNISGSVWHETEKADEVGPSLTNGFHDMLAFTGLVNESPDEITNFQAVEYIPNLYPVCTTGHTACAKCLQKGELRPLLCLRDDCYELHTGDDAHVQDADIHEASTRNTSASTLQTQTSDVTDVHELSSQTLCAATLQA